MPDRKQLSLLIGDQIQDLSKVRLAGLDKPFDKLTIGELVQLRPGAEVADSYDVSAVGDNVSVSTSSSIAELGRIQGNIAMQQVVNQARLNAIQAAVMPSVGMGARSAEEPKPGEVALPTEEEDIFKASSKDPFKA